MKKRDVYLVLFLVITSCAAGIWLYYLYNEKNEDYVPPDISEIKKLSGVVFEMVDKGYLHAGDRFELSDTGSCDEKIPKEYIDLLEKNFHDLYALYDIYVWIADQNTVMVEYDGTLFTGIGFAVLRNNAEPKRNIDGFIMDYTKIEPGIYEYTAND